MANAHAHALRRDCTDAERRLWTLLRGRRLEGFKFRRQHPIGMFIADFACVMARLVIEADGGQHCDAADDARRTAWLGERGWRVVRFWNDDILARPEVVVEVVLAELRGRQLR